jgi:hypothetical protein
MGKTKAPKNLRPRPSASSANLDVLIAVDGSGSITPDNFVREKQLCNALAARLGAGSQLGVIQFGTTAQIVISLTTDIPELEKKVDAMVQIGGGTNLLAALENCYTDFSLTRRPTNAKQIWIVTDGEYDQPSPTALMAQKLAREKQVTIYGIGVGNGVKKSSLDRVCSLQCTYMVQDFDSAVKVMQADGQKDLSVQLNAELTFLEDSPLRLGQEAIIRLEITNVGKKPVPVGSRVIFKGNDYFREKFAVFPETIGVGQEFSIILSHSPSPSPITLCY